MCALKAKDVHEHLLSLNGGWVDPNDTVDRFIVGDPETEIKGIAVGWMSYTWALEKAVSMGCNLFVTHEPTFYNHPDHHLEEHFQHEGVRKKLQLIEEHHMTILRCHDVWDQLPEIGIPDSWAKFLGYQKPIGGEGYFRVYDGGGKPAGEIAQSIANCIRDLGQESVQLVGPANKQVSRICLGTGAMTPFNTYLEKYQADFGICTDDGMFHCFQGALAIDLNIPMVVVNHAVSEEPGVINLANYLQNMVSDIPVHHIPQQCAFQSVYGD